MPLSRVKTKIEELFGTPSPEEIAVVLLVYTALLVCGIVAGLAYASFLRG